MITGDFSSDLSALFRVADFTMAWQRDSAPSFWLIPLYDKGKPRNLFIFTRS